LSTKQKAFFDKKYSNLSDDAFLANKASVRLTIDYRKIAALFNRLDLNKSLILDLGCGDQPQAYIFATQATCSIVGLDFSEFGLKLASDRATAIGYPGTFTPVLGNALSLPFEDGTFDAAVHSMTLEHIDNPPQAIAEVARVLKKGGKLFVYTVNSRHILRGIYEKLFPSHYEAMCHSKEGAFTMEQLCSWFEKSGLDVEEHLFAFSFESAIWDYYLLPRIIRLGLAGHERFMRLVSGFRTLVSWLAIIDRLLKRTGNSSCLVVVGSKR
jgi:ubiquinone/menaquinone biosynthesis C-methylase UbiE